MKKFASLGRSLSFQEQQSIRGGDDPGDTDLGNCESPMSCTCGSTSTSFTCCSNHMTACIDTHCGSGATYGCR